MEDFDYLPSVEEWAEDLHDTENNVKYILKLFENNPFMEYSDDKYSMSKALLAVIEYELIERFASETEKLLYDEEQDEWLQELGI